MVRQVNKFTRVVILVAAIAFGWGLGQGTRSLIATTYPVGAAGVHPIALASDVSGTLPHGSTSNDSTNVHGLGVGVNVYGNLDAADEYIQRSTFDPSAAGGGDNAIYMISPADTQTFGTAFSAAPYVWSAGRTDNLDLYVTIHKITTTTFDFGALATSSGANVGANERFVASGS